MQQLYTYYVSTCVHRYACVCVYTHEYIVCPYELTQSCLCNFVFALYLCAMCAYVCVVYAVTGVDWSPTGPRLACGNHCMWFWFDVCTCHTHYVPLQWTSFYIFYWNWYQTRVGDSDIGNFQLIIAVTLWKLFTNIRCLHISATLTFRTIFWQEPFH